MSRHNHDTDRVKTVGRCIYCGVTPEELPPNGRLTKEHIAAEGIQGDYQLRQASCETCRDLTQHFELSFLRNILGTVRAHYQLYGKKYAKGKKQSPQSLPVTLRFYNWKTLTMPIPLERHPLVFWLPVLEAPGLLRGEPKEAGFEKTPVFRPIGNEQTLIRTQALVGWPVTDVAQTQRTPLGDFCKTLAKMAYGFAIFHFGYGTFTPLVTDLIRLPKHDARGSLYYVGGAFDAENIPVKRISGYQNTVQTLIREIRGEDHVVSWIHLCPWLNTPVYEVVVGKCVPTHNLRERANALSMEITAFS